jgi:uncharacterized membrane protein YeaQ/YmgE (transglycosylase-associated protein family)
MMNTLILASFSDRLQSEFQYYTHDWKSFLILLFIGAVAGLLAEFLVGSKGFGMIVTIILGIVGSWLGNVLFAGMLTFTSNELVNRIVYATVGAMILVIIFSMIFRLRGRDRTDRQS